MQICIIALAAFAASIINAIAGGGTFITFPALTGIGKLSEKAANVTSTIGIWPGTASSVVAAKAEFKSLPRTMLISYCLISLVGGTAGAVLLLVTSNSAFKLVIPWLMGFATIIFALSKPISRWAGRHQGEPSLKWTVLVGCVQFAVAVYGGYFGAGIGVLMMAGLSFTGLRSIHQITAMKVLLASVINGISCLIFIFGPVQWHMAGIMAIAAVIGGFVGMALARKIKPDHLRAIVILVGASLTIVYFVKNY